MKQHPMPGLNPLSQPRPHPISPGEYLRRLAPVFLLSAITFLLVFMWLLLPSIQLKAAGRYLYVATTGVNNPTCSISTPCRTIQYAVDIASSDNEIRVAAGTYAEGVSVNQNLTLRGGFSTSDWFANPDPETNRTIINAQEAGRVLTVTATGMVTVTGFHLTGGADAKGGGGAYNSVGTLTLENNQIYQNTDTGDVGGGGVLSDNGTLILKRNRIYSNTSDGIGGGVNIADGSATLEANEIHNNAATAGGGISIYNGTVSLKSNLIYNNTGNVFGGGGLYVAAGTVTVENNTLFANTTPNQGGGIRVYGGTVAITNNLIISNTAVISGGGIYKYNAATIPLAYTDFFGNSPNQVEYETGGAQTPAGTNRTQNPLFTAPASFNLHLLPGSPAIDSGAITSSATIDFEGEGRPFGAGMDRGADEDMPQDSDCYARISGGQVYTNAQAAINAASAGNTVQIAGRCTATGNQVLYISQTLTIRGGYTRTNWAEPIFGPTVLAANGAAQGVYILGNSNIAPTLDGFHITGADGAGVVVNGVARPVVQNNVIYNNGGNGVTHGNGASTLQHNTVYGNGKNGIENSGGQMIIANNLIINNGQSGISGTISLNTVYANDVFGNSISNYGNAQTDPAGNGNLSVDPNLANPAGGNFHLNTTSPVIGKANADYTPALDMDGDTRPQGRYGDIGADEATSYAEGFFSPASRSRVVDQNTTTVYTHTFTNNGTQTDQFNISFSHSTTWTASVVPTGAITLNAGEERVVTATLVIPAEALSGQEDVLVITATSTNAPSMFATATDISVVRITPGAVFVPQYRQPADPGKTITLTHILTNTGTYTDSFGIELGFIPQDNLTGDSWGMLLPSAPYTEATPSGIYTYTLGKNQSMAIQVQVSVPISAEDGLENTFYLIATSQADQSPQPNFSTRVTDTIIANAISGDRYVSPDGNDTINNCIVKEAPCATIKRGVQTVSVGNTVFATTGLYPENNIQINGVITLTGGCVSDYSTCAAHPGKTIIDGENEDRILWILSGSDPIIQGFTIQNGNASAPGAGLYIEGNASPVIQGNQFFSNTTSTGGGGIAVETGNPVIKNNVFFNNSANAGGGIHVAGGDATLLNNTFISNTAVTGGGVYNTGGESPVSNSIFAHNVATANSGAVYNQLGATTLMDYNNFYHNSAPANADSNAPTGSNSLALEPGLADVAALDFHLVITSSMIDVADPDTQNEVDYEYDLRPTDQGYDIGADEFAGCLAQVASTGIIYGSAQTAVDAALLTDTVRIHGTCRGVHPLTTGGRVVYQTVHLTKEVSLSGGWDATFKSREPYATLDAEGLGRALLITGTINPAIERLTFINGSAVGLGGGPAGEDAGGAVYNFAGAPAFKDVVIQACEADLGGGMYNHSGAPTFDASVLDSLGRIINNAITTNTATINGGGFYNYSGDPVFAYTTFAANEAQNGGGFYNEQGAPFFAGIGNQFRANQVTQNGGGFYNKARVGINSAQIYLNWADGNGGGVYNSSSQIVTMTNLVVYSNTAVNGAGFYNEKGNPRIWNATAALNTATGNGGAFYNYVGTPELINSILFNNQANNGGGVYAELTAPTLRYNNVFSNTGGNYVNIAATGVGSISADPQFLDNTYHLSPDSPAMDAADPDTWVSTDFDGQPRPGNMGYDMGADEINACFAIINEDTSTIYGSVQQALDNSLNTADVIKVSGHCLGTSSFEGGAVTAQVYVDKSRTIQGGWNQTFTTLDPAVYSTTLDALDQGHVIYVPSGVQPIIENFHIVHGYGSAIYNTSQLTVTLRANEIHDNTSDTDGAGIYNAGDKLVVEGGNRIYSNTTTGNGGAFYSGSGTPVVQNNFIYSNTAAYGGGIYIGGGSAIIRHNTLDENRATVGLGAGIYRFGGSPDIRNNIVVGGSGSGIHSGGGSGQANYNLVTPASGDYSNSDGWGNLTGPNDIHTAPTFTETARVSRDYHLLWGGSGPDQGDPDLFGELPVDFEGDLRPSHQGMDIGADEIGGCYARINGEEPYYGSAQYAVDQAQPGDIVDVAGTCLGVNSKGGAPQNLYINQTITLRGGWRWDEDNKAFGARNGVTNLDPGALGRGIHLAGGNGTVDRFRIYNSLGGAIYNDGTATLVQNNVLFNNTATDGAGIHNASGDLRVWHNTIISNTATGNGGAMYVAGGRPEIHNNIFGNNAANDGSAVFVMPGATPNLDYNNTWNDTYGGNASAGSHDVDDNPNFKNLDPAHSDFVKLPSYSPVIDKGNGQNNTVQDDFEGQPRPSNLGYDIGADEYASCLAKIVNTGEIFGHVQDAVDVAEDNNTILVAGTCEIRTGDDQTVLLNKPLTLQGGYDENFDTVDPPLSTLSGSNAAGHTGRVVVVESGADVIVKIQSFEIVNGRADDGAGIHNAGKLNLVGPINVAYNEATGNGGGVYNATGGELTIEDGSLYGGYIRFNSASGNGGGIYNAGTLTGGGWEGVSNNTAANGAGLYNDGGQVSFRNSAFQDNTADEDGGGIYSRNGDNLTTTNVLIRRNSAGQNGGGFYSDNGNLVIYHNTIRDNSATGTGGAFYKNAGTVTISNTIIYANSAASHGDIYNTNTSLGQYAYTDFYDNAPATIISNATRSLYDWDPLLYGYTPSIYSPAIDAGGPNTHIDFDCNNTPRPYNLGYDLGMVEVEITRSLTLQHLAPPTPDSTVLQTQYADPGTTVTFTHILTNNSQLTDTFDIAIIGSTQPAWVISLTTPASVTLPSKSFTTVLVSVSVPTGTLAGVTDDTQLQVSSQLARADYEFDQTPNEDPDGAPRTVIVTDRTIVNTLVNFEISDNEGYGAPGQTLTYTHLITNAGNVSDTLRISTNPQYASLDVLTPTGDIVMPVGATATLTVSVTIPLWLAGGIDDTGNVILRPVHYPAGETAGADTTYISYTTGTRYVSLDGNDGDNYVASTEKAVKWNNCTDPLKPACRTLAHALEQAAPGDLIKVAGGTYSQTVTQTVGSDVLTQVLFIDKSVAIQGGYSTLDWDNSQPFTNPTVIDPQEMGRGAYVTGTAVVTLDSLKFTNGLADEGAAIYNAATLTLQAATVARNNAPESAADSAGAVYNTGRLAMRNTILISNKRYALYQTGSGRVLVEFNTFYGNGGVTEDGFDSGAIRSNTTASGALTVTNNIFQNHLGTGGPIQIDGTSPYSIATNIFYSNEPGGVTGDNPLNVDPQLVDPDNNDLHLQPGSPAENAAVSLNPPAEDFEHELRPQKGGYDIGADEQLYPPVVIIAPDRSGTVDAGGTITYTHTITNAGPETDVITLTATSSPATNGWTANFVPALPATVTLTAGQTRPITVVITAGSTGTGGQVDRTVITATSSLGFASLGRAVYDIATDVTTVTQNAALQFAPNRSETAASPGVVTYTHTLTNTGNGQDSFTFSAASSRGWAVTLPPDVTDLAAMASQPVVFTLTVPAGMGGLTDTTTLTATSAASSAVQAAVVNTTTVPAIANLEFAPSYSQTGAPGATVNYELTLTNTGNTTDTFNLVVTSGWTANLFTTPITLAAGRSALIYNLVDIPPGAPVGMTDRAVVTATSSISPALFRTVVNTTTVVSTTVTGQAPLSISFTDSITTGLVNTPYTLVAAVSPTTTSIPITYTWQATDLGISSTPSALLRTDNKEYTWSTPGVKTILITATNGYGPPVTATRRITIEGVTTPVEPQSVTISGPTAGVINTGYTFIATVSPTNASTPITYTWQATNQSPVITTTASIAFTWNTSGTQVITVTADNGYGTTVVDTHTVTVTISGQAPTGVTITGPITGLVNNTYAFTATVNPDTTPPVTYTWQATENDSIIQSNNQSDVASFSWPTAGVKVITVTANNGYGSPVVATHTITITSGATTPVEPGSVTITGPVTGQANAVQNFTATVSPAGTTTPITYTWQATDYPTPIVVSADSPQNIRPYTWPTAGVKVITVTANNGYGTTVVDTHTITITSGTTPPPVAPGSVTITGPVTGQANAVQNFTATVSPANASLPLTYIWQADGLAPVTHTNIYTVTDANPFSWPTTGTKVITVTANNGYGSPVVATHTITITSATTPPVAPQSVAISGPVTGPANAVQNFTATVNPADASLPLTYIWQADGRAPVTHTNIYTVTDANPFSWPTTGAKVVTVTAANAYGTVVDTHTIVISGTTPPVLPQQVIISGPDTGPANAVQNFTATVNPASASQPITYTWQADGLPTVSHPNVYAVTDANPFSWPTTGVKVVTVTAGNAYGTVVDTHTIVISGTTPPVLPQQVIISGPITGTVNGASTFIATVSPASASQPITYTWQADGLPTVSHPNVYAVTDANPFSWPTTGVKVVTVTADNGYGAVTATHTITITGGGATPSVSPQQVVISGLSTGVTATPYSFTATVTPPTTTLPITYYWQATDYPTPIVVSADSLQNIRPYTWATAGVKVITVTASNGIGTVNATHTITISAPQAPTGVTITGPATALTGQSNLFTATVSPPNTTTPITYTWQVGGQPPVITTSASIPLTWNTPGTQVITVTATNGYGSAVGVFTVTVRVPTYAPTGVIITGRTTGITATAYSFTATVSPPTTTLPITYTWQADGQPATTMTTNSTQTVRSYSWPTTGAKVITVTADNGYGSPVTDVHTITINPRSAPSTIYLPLTMKDYSPPPPPDGPDVVVTGITYDQATGKATVSVRNQGNRRAEHWFFVDLYIDYQPTDLSDLSVYYGYSPYHGLAAGDSANVVISGTVTIPAGNHQLYALADVIDGTWGLPPDGQVSETDETNNGFGPVSLTVSRANRPDAEAVEPPVATERTGHPEADR